jgi:hypothetical protein
MDLMPIRQVMSLNKNIFNDVFSMLLYTIPLAVAMIFLVAAISGRLEYLQKKMKYSTLKQKIGRLKRVTEYLCQFKLLKKLLHFLAVRIGMYNRFNYSKNLEIAVVVLISSAALSLLSLIVLLPSGKLIWYMVLAYFSLAAAFLTLLLYIFSAMAKLRFTSKLPETFKMLNSRYMSRGSIQEAIWISLEDMDKAVRKEMKKVYDTLNTNDMDEINNTFNMIDQSYRNEYLTLLLNLIKQAHYKGGSSVIKAQFESTTEEILSEIEHSKDLSATTRSYILFCLLMPAGLLGVEYFNRIALGSAADQFYKSPLGIEIKIVFFIVLIMYISYLLYLEKVT